MAAVAQPSGTVTLVFTDIEGSTRLLEQLGVDGYRAALGEHRRIVRDACSRYEGYEVDTEGDSFFWAFATAQAAVSAMSEAMAGLDGGPIRVRVGIHTGHPALDPPNYLGIDVHRAARIMSSAHGGQVVLSRHTAELLDGDVELKDLGNHRFKDFDAPERIYQLGTAEHPPLKSLYRLTLPVPATPFLGREHEVADVKALLTNPDTRLLTLTGPGGTGKTRLAIQAAAQASDHYPDGTTWIPLAPLRDPTAVLSAVAAALQVRERPGTTHVELLAQTLLGRKALILLDNVEHLLPHAADDIAALIDACPTLRLLATSRERLRISAETTWAVPPLAEADGELLFLERSRAAGVDLAGDVHVSELCRRLEELPLALELAAARTVVFRPAQLLSRIGERLDLLRGDRDADARQRTLRATIEWSYELLDAEEQRVYRTLSVFAGGCTFEAAEMVADADADVLQSLLDKSLVRLRDTDGERRYWMLETIRTHAYELLDASSNAREVRRRLADWLLELARAGREALWSPDEAVWAERIEAEHANLVKTIRWLTEVEPTAAARLAADAAMVAWDGSARLREGRALLELTLATSGPIEDHARAIALYALGRLAWVEDDRALERSAFTECLALARRTGDTQLDTLARLDLGWTAFAEGAFDEARDLAETGAEAAVRSGDRHLRQKAFQLRGVLAEHEGDLDLAGRLHGEALSLARSIGNRRAVTGQLGNLGWIELQREEYAAAESYFVEALEVISPSDLENRAYMHGNLGMIALARGDGARVDEELRLCLEICRNLGMLRTAAEALTALAVRAATAGDTQRAFTLWAASDGLHETSGSMPSVVEERFRSRDLEPLAQAARPYGAAAQRARHMTLDAAVEYALSTTAESEASRLPASAKTNSS